MAWRSTIGGSLTFRLAALTIIVLSVIARSRSLEWGGAEKGSRGDFRLKVSAPLVRLPLSHGVLEWRKHEEYINVCPSHNTFLKVKPDVSFKPLASLSLPVFGISLGNRPG
jgi:hypothetical protein